MAIPQRRQLWSNRLDSVTMERVIRPIMVLSGQVFRQPLSVYWAEFGYDELWFGVSLSPLPKPLDHGLYNHFPPRSV